MGIKNAVNGLKKTYLDNNSVSTKEMLGFAGGIFGNAMGQDSYDTFADKFSRNFSGISNSDFFIKDNISTILGFVFPPLAGVLYDMPVKKGKQSNIMRALKIMPLPFAISSMLLFIVPTANPAYNFIWTLFFSILFSLVDTFFDIALSALSYKMVTDPADRKKFYTFEAISSTLGSMLPGGIMPVIVGLFKESRQQQWAYFFVALGFCIIGVTAMYAPYMTVRDRASTLAGTVKSEKEEKIKWNKTTVMALLHNRPFMAVQAAAVFEVIRQITYKILPYLYDDTFNDYKMKTIIDAISGSLSYVGLMAVPFLGKKLSAKAMLSGGYLYTAFFYGIMSLFNIRFDLENVRKKRYIAGLCIGFSGIPNAAQGAARKILIADSTDYMEWYSEKHYGTAVRLDGLISAAQNIIAKFNNLLKTNLYNLMFTLIKYKTRDLNSTDKPVQSPETLRGIFAVASLCGLIGNILPAVCFLFDNFSGDNKKKIYEELAEMRAKRAAE